MKKFLSALLIVVMVLSLVACGTGDNKPTAKKVIKQILDTKVTSSEMYMHFTDDDGSNYHIKLDQYGDSNKNAVLEIYAKFSSDTYNLDDYEKVTDIYVIDGKKVYFNTMELKKFLVKVDNQFAMFTAIFSFPGDYLLIDKEGVENVCKQFGVEVPEAVEDVEQLGEVNKDEVANVLGGILDELVSKVSEGSIVVTDNDVTFHLTKESLDSILNALGEMDFEKYLSKEEKAKIEAGSFNKECHEKVNELKAQTSDFNGLQMDVVFGSDGENITASIDAKGAATVSSVSASGNVSVTYKSGNDVREVKEPESVMSMEDFVGVVSKLLGAFLNN